MTAEFEKILPTIVVDDEAGVRRHLRALLDAGINFHPDDTARDVVEGATGERTFTGGEAALLDAAMLRCRDVLIEAHEAWADEANPSDEELDEAGDDRFDICGVACEVFSEWERDNGVTTPLSFS